MVKKINLAVLISGRGSNLENLINKIHKSDFPATIKVVISNKENALGLTIANMHNINSYVVNHRDFSNRESFDKKVDSILVKYQCQVICLAGFMRILSNWFVDKWFNSIINIHPSLLPSFKGSNAVRDALSYGVKYSGCTAHLVRNEVDTGPIIKQEIVKVDANDNLDSLSKKILVKEHIVYPESVKILCNNILNSPK